MENRDQIIANISKKLLTILENGYICELDLKKFDDYFLTEEIEEFEKKKESISYLDEKVNKKEFLESNIELLVFAIQDMQAFLIHLKNKKKKFIYEIFNECLEAVKSFKNFYNFVFDSEFYFENYRHFFSVKEKEKYKNIWNMLEEELAAILSTSDTKEIEERWEENFLLIIERIQEMLTFLNSFL